MHSTRRFFATTLRTLAVAHAEARRRDTMVPRREFYANGMHVRHRMQGDAIVRAIWDEFKVTDVQFPRSAAQNIMLRVAIMASSEQIYRNEFPAVYWRLLRQNNWERIRPLAAMATARRWGKTTVLALLCAALLLNARNNIVIAVFSPTQRQSNMFVESVYDKLRIMDPSLPHQPRAEIGTRLQGAKKNELRVFNRTSDSLNTLIAYPGTVRTPSPAPSRPPSL